MIEILVLEKKYFMNDFSSILKKTLKSAPESQLHKLILIDATQFGSFSTSKIRQIGPFNGRFIKKVFQYLKIT